MATTLEDARDQVKYGRAEARFVERVEPGQRLVRLARNEYGHYLPELVEVVSATPSGRVTVFAGIEGHKKVTIGLACLFYEPSAWCDAWLNGGIYASVIEHNGTHHDGIVSFERRVFSKVYPRSDEPTRARVLADWRAHPETFTEGWCKSVWEPDGSPVGS